MIGSAISALLLNCSLYPARCGAHSKVHVSRTMNLGVGSILTRNESGDMWTRTWLVAKSGTESTTWISNGAGPEGGASEIFR